MAAFLGDTATWKAAELQPGQWPQALDLCLFESITRYRPVGTHAVHGTRDEGRRSKTFHRPPSFRVLSSLSLFLLVSCFFLLLAAICRYFSRRRVDCSLYSLVIVCVACDASVLFLRLCVHLEPTTDVGTLAVCVLVRSARLL